MGGPPDGYIATLAQNYSALLVSLEHRFYGESIPGDDMSTENLHYLTVDQALADLNSFISFYTEEGKTGASSWFIFGGSYPGALASWFRASYPDSTAGALSSSGVVNCIIDYYDFDMAVTAAIGNTCANQIRRTNAAYEGMLATPAGFQKALSLFGCESDMWTEDFYYMIADSWSMADQYGSKAALCDTMLALGEDASAEALTTTFAKFTTDYWGADFCTMGFYNTEQLADPARWDANSRSWRWQTCYEVSYFNTAPKSGSLRSTTVDMDYHLRQCKAIFGEAMFPSSVAMNEKFGGQFPHASKVFYSDFSDDPWQRASVNYEVTIDQPYALAMCDGCGHCRDFHDETENDPQQLKDLRSEFDSYLYQWLEEAK
jgi:pimeloyl-ACP methyl ester carboxylesterase